jgi:hypothetical protein
MPGSFFSRVRRSLGFGEEIEREAPVSQPDPNKLAPGGVDEVKVDLGPDEGGAGLLERWVDPTSSGEPTVAPPVNAPPAELPEVTIKAPRAAIPFDRTIPRVDPEPAPGRDVTVTEVVSPARVPWGFFAAIAILLLSLLYAFTR